MVDEKAELAVLKDKGFLQQRQGNRFSMRIKVVGGRVDAEELRKIADAAEKYGSGYVHLTSRQQIEVPHVRTEDALRASRELEAQGLHGGAAGKKVRAIVACQGNTVCRRGLIDCQALAARFDELYFGKPVPKKLKIAVTGCPSSCERPQDNDIGIMGVVRPQLNEAECIGCGLCAKACKLRAMTVADKKAHIDESKCILCGSCILACKKHAVTAGKVGYTVMVGGSLGHRPQLGVKVAELIDEEKMLSLVDGFVKYYQQEGREGERLGELIDRKGPEEIKRQVVLK